MHSVIMTSEKPQHETTIVVCCACARVGNLAVRFGSGRVWSGRRKCTRGYLSARSITSHQPSRLSDYREYFNVAFSQYASVLVLCLYGERR